MALNSFHEASGCLPVSFQPYIMDWPTLPACLTTTSRQLIAHGTTPIARRRAGAAADLLHGVFWWIIWHNATDQTHAVFLMPNTCRLCYMFMPSPQKLWRFTISGLRREVDENCARMGYYAACSGKFLSWTFRTELTGFPETSVNNYH